MIQELSASLEKMVRPRKKKKHERRRKTILFRWCPLGAPVAYNTYAGPCTGNKLRLRPNGGARPLLSSPTTVCLLPPPSSRSRGRPFSLKCKPLSGVVVRFDPPPRYIYILTNPSLQLETKFFAVESETLSVKVLGGVELLHFGVVRYADRVSSWPFCSRCVVGPEQQLSS